MSPRPGRSRSGELLIPDPATETAEPVEAQSAFKAEGLRRISLMDQAAKATAKPDSQPVPEKVASGDPEGAGAVEVKPAEKPATKSAPTEELKFVPEQHRSVLETASPEFVKWVKTLNDGAMKDADYRQKTTDLAQQRKALAQEREEHASSLKEKHTLVDFAETIISDPEAMRLLREHHANRQGGARAAQPKFSLADATDESFAEYMESQRRQAAEDAKAATLAEIDGRRQSETQAQYERREMALLAKAEFFDSGEYEAKEIDEVFDRLSEDGVKFSKDNIVAKLRRYLPPREAKAKQPIAATNGAGNGAKSAASVLSRAAGASPMTAPAFIREHRAPRTAEERYLEAEWIVKQRKARAGPRPS